MFDSIDHTHNRKSAFELPAAAPRNRGWEPGSGRELSAGTVRAERPLHGARRKRDGQCYENWQWQLTVFVRKKEGARRVKRETAPAIIGKIPYDPDEALTNSAITTIEKKFNLNRF
jgi:hypothetical protein